MRGMRQRLAKRRRRRAAESGGRRRGCGGGVQEARRRAVGGGSVVVVAQWCLLFYDATQQLAPTWRWAQGTQESGRRVRGRAEGDGSSWGGRAKGIWGGRERIAIDRRTDIEGVEIVAEPQKAQGETNYVAAVAAHHPCAHPVLSIFAPAEPRAQADPAMSIAQHHNNTASSQTAHNALK